MSLRYLFGLAATVLLLASPHIVRGQLVLTPDELTTRQLSHAGDATAAGWNPSLMGTRESSSEYLLAVPFGIDRSLTGVPFAAFARYGSYGAGVISGHDEELKSQTNLYAAFGWPALKGRFWIGAGVTGLLRQDDPFTAGFTISATIRPSSSMLASLSLINPTSTGRLGSAMILSGSYVFADWLSALASARYDEADTLPGQTQFKPSVGAVATINDQWNLSAVFDLSQSRVRIGAEFTFSGFGIGAISSVHYDDGFGDGLAYARYSTDRSRPNSDYSFGLPAPLAPPMGFLGWAPDRAFAPIGLRYKGRRNDAQRSEGAYVASCDDEELQRLRQPDVLMQTIADAGADYNDLDTIVNGISRDPQHLFDAIQQRYYSPPIHDAELQRDDTLSLISRKGYSIGIRSVDYSGFPNVSLLMQVTDKTGRNVPGLGAGDFAFRNASNDIVSLQQIDSRQKTPVDIVLAIDCSGSMTQKIAAVRENIRSFINLIESRGASYRIGGVLYGSIVYDTLSPTEDYDTFRNFVSRAAAIGGDEITTLAVKSALDLNFRPNAQKVVVLITDDWAIQDNANLDEADLTQALWKSGARLYTIINPCKNNSAIATRLSFGQEYDIASPFNSILDDLGTDITTMYRMVYRSNASAPPCMPQVSGRVVDYRNVGVGATIIVSDSANNVVQTTRSDNRTGSFAISLQGGARYSITTVTDAYAPLAEGLDLHDLCFGDTLRREIKLPLPETVLTGRVFDENGMAPGAQVRIENATTLTPVAVIPNNDSGDYEVRLVPGYVYRLTAEKANFIPTPVELDTRHVGRGAQLHQDLKLTGIDEAISSGARFALKNIFFDYDKWDLRPESIPELNKLVKLLNEYPSVRVEIGAHTDGNGSDEYNQPLSENRARSVVNFLIQRGVSADRLDAKGYGKTAPIATNETDEGRALNRRVEFKLVR